MTSTDRPPVTAHPTGADTANSKRMPGTRVPTLALAVLAAIAAWLSYASVRAAAVPVFGPGGGSAFPLLLDTGVFTSSEYYLRSVRANRPMTGFRTLTRALIAATIAVNVSTATTPRAALLHAVPPALFAALVELRARQILGDKRHQAGAWPDRIPARLWLTSPIESFKLSLWVAKATSHSAQRAARERHLVAIRALKLALPGRGEARTARRLVRRQLRAGTLDPAVLVTATGLDQDPDGTGAAAVLRVALRAALATATPTVPGYTPGVPGNQAPGIPAGALGVYPAGVPAAGQSILVVPTPRRTRTRQQTASQGTKNVPGYASEEELRAAALEVQQASLTTNGRPAGVRQLRRELSIGQDKATALRDWLTETTPIEHANGNAV